MKRVTIHTDGACLGNPGPGGWAAVLQYGDQSREISGGEADTTNNRMELMAAIRALEALSRPSAVTLFTDSQYVQKGMTKWLADWKAKGWRTKAKTPVLNQDLWQRLEAAAESHDITWQWVKGHAGNPLNERCDEIAEAEAKKQAVGLGWTAKEVKRGKKSSN